MEGPPKMLKGKEKKIMLRKKGYWQKHKRERMENWVGARAKTGLRGKGF